MIKYDLRKEVHIMLKRITTFMLAAICLCAALFAPTAAALSFTDVQSTDWFAADVDSLVMLGIINGYDSGTFSPDDPIKRGEFLKMAMIAAEQYTAKKPQGVHWAEEFWQMAYEAELLTKDEQTRELLFPCTFNELQKDITRYEMAVLISNILTKAYYEPRAKIESPEGGIKDYTNVANVFKDAVEQVFGKGIITGYEDGSFLGDNTLRRCEAASVISRLLWSSKRKPATFATPGERLEYDPNYNSFALQYRDMNTEQRRIALFNDPNKTYFASAAEASPYMVTVTVPTWRIGANGQKVSASETLTVHKLVKDEIVLIFNEIYNDPEQFPIKAGNIGGARFTDSLRHSWGCAIDINPTENYYCQTVGGVSRALSGSYWSPGADPYSITPGGSVVRAFAKYGWGWGGQGWSGGYYDYMHFSILPTGG